MLKLNRIQLEGYKSIKQVDIQLGALNVLIGANGSGKSNFISFFRLLNHITSNSLQLFIGESGGANSLLYYGSKTTPQMSATLDFETDAGSNCYSMRLVSAAGDSLIFADEQILFIKKGTYPKSKFSLGSGHKETMLCREDVSEYHKKMANAIYKIMNQWRFYQFHDTSKEAKIKQKWQLTDNRYLRDDAGNLASYLYMLKNQYPSHYKRIVNTIQQIAPFFDDFVLMPSELNRYYIMLEWKDKEDRMIFNANHLSDGTLRMMALITLLLQPQPPAMICIDEPELGLHPFAIKILAELLQLASSNSQIIVSTQSVPLVNLIEPENIIVVDREKKQSKFNKLDLTKLEEWLNDYSLGELWEKNVIGGRPSL